MLAFYSVDQVAEDLLRENTRSRASKLISILLYREHLLKTGNGEDKKLNASMINDLDSPDFKDIQLEIVAFDESIIHEDRMSRNMIYPQRVLSDDEKELLSELKENFEARLERRKKEVDETAVKTGRPEKILPSALPSSILGGKNSRLYEERFNHSNYEYYEPLHFTFSCTITCHNSNRVDLGNLRTGPDFKTILDNDDSGDLNTENTNVNHVIKIILPSEELQTAVNKVRAILIAVAILTVFLAMIGLYIIIRYIIVKPLNHLRQVSENVRRGKTETRADLKTGDEFDDLANAFNSMLRHLIDTQHKLKKANGSLDRKVEELAQMNVRLYEMNQIKSDFLANMSHELRTPLNSIIGFSEVLQGIDALQPSQHRYVSNIRNSGQVLLQMINEILDLAKLEAGKMEVNPSEFRVENLIEAHCELFQSLAADKNIDLQFRCPPNLAEMYQDQVKIQQILSNLLSNAVKFTPEGGRILVTAERANNENLKMVVSDTGVGIAAEDCETIFEKFRQAKVIESNSLTREFSGTGLGLSIVKEICNLLRGSVSLQSEIGKGSEFTVTIPWVCRANSQPASEFDQKLNEITKARLSDFRDAIPPISSS